MNERAPERTVDIEGLPERFIADLDAADIARGGARPVSGALRMHSRMRTFGAVVLHEVFGSLTEFERRPPWPGSPTWDLVFIDRGTFAYLSEGTWKPASGRLMIGPSGIPGRVRLGRDCRFLIVRVPKVLLPAPNRLREEVRFGTHLTLIEESMRAFVARAVRSEKEIAEGESAAVDRILVEMAGAVLLGRLGRDPVRASPRAALRERALGELARRAAEPSFAPADLARATGASLRHLQGVFAEAGISVAGELRRVRAEAAHALLRDPAHDGLDMETVAARAGFGSARAMRTALERQLGSGPRALRSGRDRL